MIGIVPPHQPGMAGRHGPGHSPVVFLRYFRKVTLIQAAIWKLQRFTRSTRMYRLLQKDLSVVSLPGPSEDVNLPESCYGWAATIRNAFSSADIPVCTPTALVQSHQRRPCRALPATHIQRNALQMQAPAIIHRQQPQHPPHKLPRCLQTFPTQPAGPSSTPTILSNRCAASILHPRFPRKMGFSLVPARPRCWRRADQHGLVQSKRVSKAGNTLRGTYEICCAQR
jgi:hypothetical protein